MTIKNGMAPVHPGEVLRDELDEIGLSANALAKAIDVPANRVTAILNGDRGITADTALRLARYFDTTAQFWLNLQQACQIRQAEVAAGERIVERIVPRETEALRDAARAARLGGMAGVDAVSTAPFMAIECNRALRDQLQAVERSLRTHDINLHMLRALEGPLAELRTAGVFASALGEKLTHTSQWLVDYECRFKVPESQALSRLVEELGTVSNLARVDESFKFSIATMKSAWLDTNNELGSVQRLFDLRVIGELVSRTSSFEWVVAESLRSMLGDWRDTITWPESIWSDLGARAEFYDDLGFDAELTDLPAPAFREASGIAHIRSEPPSLVEDYGPPVPMAPDSNEEESLARTNQAHDWLQRLESHLRDFIDHEMRATFGSDWPRHQLPNEMYDKWIAKKEAADRQGAPARPLIVYADFTDYVLIICRRDNWRQVFSSIFDREESVRESFQRLHPIRLDTMHARPITQDDELLLYVETKRLTKHIGTQSLREV